MRPEATACCRLAAACTSRSFSPATLVMLLSDSSSPAVQQNLTAYIYSVVAQQHCLSTSPCRHALPFAYLQVMVRVERIFRDYMVYLSTVQSEPRHLVSYCICGKNQGCWFPAIASQTLCNYIWVVALNSVLQIQYGCMNAGAMPTLF